MWIPLLISLQSWGKATRNNIHRNEMKNKRGNSFDSLIIRRLIRQKWHPTFYSWATKITFIASKSIFRNISGMNRVFRNETIATSFILYYYFGLNTMCIKITTNFTKTTAKHLTTPIKNCIDLHRHQDKHRKKEESLGMSRFGGS